MNYKAKDYKEIFLRELNTALENRLISHQEDFEAYVKNKQDISNFYVMTLSICAEAVEEVYDQMTLEYLSTKVRYATGQDLDDLGVLVGCERPLATRAGVELTFTLTRTMEEDYTHPRGIIVYGETTGIEYVTSEQLYIAAGSRTVKVQAYAKEPGVKYNVIEHELTNINNDSGTNLSLLRVDNETASTGGSEAFTDAEYRYLLSNWILINQKGNEIAFIDYLARFDGIDGYKFIPNWDGTGTLKIILDPGTAEQLNRAYNDLQSIVSQASEDIYMTSPDKVPIDVYATVNVDIDVVNPYSSSEKEDIAAKIVSATKLFIDGGGYRKDGTYWKGLMIGEDFIPHKLATFLDSEIPELKNIIFSHPSEPITVKDEEIGTANIISIEMV